ncbi:hypothetical protein ACFWU5_16990 [Nocardia sp. NPDC058640]
MGTEGDNNERGDRRPAAEFGPPVSDFGPPVDDEGFGGPVPVTPPPVPTGVPELGWRPAGPPAGGPAAGHSGPPVGGGAAPGPFGPPAGGPGPSGAPAGPPAGGGAAPGPFGPPAGAPAPGPFGAPVAGQPPVAPPPAGPFGAPVSYNTMPPGPPVGPPRQSGPTPQAPPRSPDNRRSAPTSVFGDAVATPPPAQSGPRQAAPFGGPTPGGPPSADPTVRFGGKQGSGDAVGTPPSAQSGPRQASPFGGPTPADPTVRFGGEQGSGDSVFGDSVPVTSGRELTEVIRRGRPDPKKPASQGPSSEVPPEPVRPPDGTRTPLFADEPKPAADKWWDADDDGAIPKPPAEPGLSWADDPIARRLAPKTPTTPPPAEPELDSKRMRWIIGGVAAAVLLVVALVLTIGLVKRGGGADPGVTAAPVTSAASATECQSVAEQSVTVGNGPGDTTTGARAILGFQYAFYTDRSGAKVREFVAPDAENISPAETIQQAIDGQIPAGTTHCVKMRETTVGRYDVELREMHPDGSAVVYKQEIITTNTDGKWQVKSITAR